MSEESPPTENATTIRPTDVPIEDRLDNTRSKREHYRTLRRDNQTGQSSGWSDTSVRSRSERRAVVDALAGQLALTDHQQRRAKLLLDDISGETFSGFGISIAALCLCGLVGREDGRGYHPNQILSKESGPFIELANDLNASHGELYSCWERIASETGVDS